MMMYLKHRGDIRPGGEFMEVCPRLEAGEELLRWPSLSEAEAKAEEGLRRIGRLRNQGKSRVGQEAAPSRIRTRGHVYCRVDSYNMGGVSDQFKVDEEGYTSDGYRRLESRSRGSMYMGNAVVAAILAAIILAFVLQADSVFAEYAGGVKAVLLALLIACVAYLAVSPEVKYRRYRYRIDSDKLEIRKGVVTVTHQMVPVERIHQVDVVRGPVNRLFGLANVTVTTAGGVVTLEYLEESVAEDVASKLNESVVSVLKGRR